VRPGRGRLLGLPDLVAQFVQRVRRARLPEPGEEVALLVGDVRPDLTRQPGRQPVGLGVVRLAALQVLHDLLGLGVLRRLPVREGVPGRARHVPGTAGQRYASSARVPDQFPRDLIGVQLAVLVTGRQCLDLPEEFLGLAVIGRQLVGDVSAVSHVLTSRQPVTRGQRVTGAGSPRPLVADAGASPPNGCFRRAYVYSSDITASVLRVDTT
jgi:hypothetical protein